jgi:hypothetical protein
MGSEEKNKPEGEKDKVPDKAIIAGNVIGDKQDSSYIFARHFVEARYTDIPGDVVEAVKKSVLDTLGVSIAATTLGQ